jgi:hypothetical protein
MNTSKGSNQVKDDNGQIKRILDELENAVADLPLVDMIETITLNDGLKSRTALTISDWADKLIRQLAAMGLFGDKDAVRALRDIGIQVNSALTSLTQGGDNEAAQGKPGRQPTLEFVGAKTTVKLAGDFSPVTDILRQQSSKVSSFPPAEIQKLLKSKLRPGSQGLIDLDVGTALTWHDEPLEYLASTESVMPNHYKEWRRRMRIAPAGSLPEMSPENPHAALHTGLEGMIAGRLLSIANDTARKAVNFIASESLTWPTFVSALEDIQPCRDSYLASLPLADGLPFRTKRKGVAGKKRDFQRGTQAAFALEYCVKLNAIRSSHINSGAAQLESIRQRVEGHEALRSANLVSYYQSLNDVGGWSSLNRDGLWVFKAALLPPFPPEDKGRSPESVACFKEWLKVAMLRAERLCSGDWEIYPWWPRCVTARAGYNSRVQRDRTLRETVREKLQEGMKILQKAG